jgi:choline dehydrogenase-like flavoprotein
VYPTDSPNPRLKANVSAGPAGAALASRVAQSSPSLRVLLIEAGGSNSEVTNRVLYDRYATFVTVPDYNWNYMTTPQPSLRGKSLFYARGKGLGGSTSINFCCYTIRPKDDFDEWARLVGDNWFDWNNAKRRFSELETFRTPMHPDVARYSNLAEWHGTEGPLSVEYPDRYEKSLAPSMEAFKETGFELNPDINSGYPLGMGVSPSTASKGTRVTAASTFLEPKPENLTIKINTPIARVLLEGKRAVGVEAINGEKCKF